MFLVVFLVITTSLTLLLWRFSRWAGRIEDDSAEFVHGSDREPYGLKWLNILRFRE